MVGERFVSKTTLDNIPGKDRQGTWGRKQEEYMADFCLVSKRALDENEYRLFRYHFLLGADWRLCSRKLGVDRGTFFHSVYRIQEKLGRIFRELEPYPLFPLTDYFHGPIRPSAIYAVPPGAVVPIRPPVNLREPDQKVA